jgi:hypothetical protein
LSCGAWNRQQDLAALLEIAAKMKALAGDLLQAQAYLVPLLQQAVRAQAQRIAALLEEASQKPSLSGKVTPCLSLKYTPRDSTHPSTHHQFTGMHHSGVSANSHASRSHGLT